MSMAEMSCPVCGEIGHYGLNCPQRVAAVVQAEYQRQAPTGGRVGSVAAPRGTASNTARGWEAAAPPAPPQPGGSMADPAVVGGSFPPSPTADEQLTIAARQSGAAAGGAKGSDPPTPSLSLGSGSPPAGQRAPAAFTTAAAAASAGGPPPLPPPPPPPGPSPREGVRGLTLKTRFLSGMGITEGGDFAFALPRTLDECTTQAAQSVLRAWDDGVRRQALELALPQARAEGRLRARTRARPCLRREAPSVSMPGAVRSAHGDGECPPPHSHPSPHPPPRRRAPRWRAIGPAACGSSSAPPSL